MSLFNKVTKTFTWGQHHGAFDVNDHGARRLAGDLAGFHRDLVLTPHFKTHLKDHHGRRGLLKMVNARKRLLS